MNKDTFLTLSEAEQLAILDQLHDDDQPEQIIDLLTSIGLDQLSSFQLGRLAVAYNNNDQEAAAMAVLDRIPEADRDAKWYYRYGYALTCKNFPARPREEEKRQALTMFNRSVELADDDTIKDHCLELVNLVIGQVFFEANKADFPALYDYYVSSRPSQLQADQQESNYNDLSLIYWTFGKETYSEAEFEESLDALLSEDIGANWREHAVNAPIEVPRLMVVYEAWIESLDQLHANETIEDADELNEDDKEDGLWQVEVLARLTADNGKFFTPLELLYKLHHLMANKELGDHVFFEGLEYQGHECEANGLIDKEDGLPVFYVLCGS